MGRTRDPPTGCRELRFGGGGGGGGEPSEMEVVAERRGDAGGVTCQSVV
jgi:hypothetical protein